MAVPKHVASVGVTVAFGGAGGTGVGVYQAAKDAVVAKPLAKLIVVERKLATDLSGRTAWKTYRQARTDSSHTYDAAKAEAVFALAPQFLEEAQALLHKLQARHDPA